MTRSNKNNDTKNLISKVDELTVYVTMLTATISKQKELIGNQTKVINDLQLVNQTQAEKIKEIEACLNKNSNNSSKPPSSDELNKPKPKSLRKNLVNLKAGKSIIKVAT